MPRGFVREGEWVAECFFADSSAFSKDFFYLEAFALPLFVPTDYLYFNYGFRVGGYEAVTKDVVTGVRKASDRLAKMATLDGLEKSASNDLEIRTWELKMYSAILRNKLDRAQELSETINGWKIERAWEAEVVERAAKIAALLRGGGRPTALEGLARNRDAVRELLT